MTLAYSTHDIRNFNGGLTDRVVDSEINTFERLHNFRLDKNANMDLREGCELESYGNSGHLNLIRRSLSGNIYGIAGNNIIYHYPEGASPRLYTAGSIGNIVTPDDVGMSSFDWRGIEYITTTRDESSTAVSTNKTRQPLYSLYTPQKPIAGDQSSYMPIVKATGCPSFSQEPSSIAHLTGGNNINKVPTRYYITYKQRIVANENTTIVTTQDSYGLGWYSDELSLDRSYDSTGDPSNVRIDGLASSIRSGDYDERADIAIYRTLPDTLSVYYLVGTVPSPASGTTVSFDDSVLDHELIENERLYISEGISEMSQPPRHTCSAVINGTAFYGNVEVTTKTVNGVREFKEYNYKVIQSMVGNPTNVNLAWHLDFDSEVVGLAGLFSALIVFTKTKIFRIDGFYNNDGSGGYNKRTISDDAGCLSHRSIVSSGETLFFCGNNGVYSTDGYQVNSISSTQKYDITNTYREYTKDYISSENIGLIRSRIVGYFDINNDVMYWSVCRDGSSVSNEVLIYDLFNSCFYTMGGNNMTYSTMLVEKGHFLRGSDHSSIFRHERGMMTDVVTENSIQEDWFESYIPYKAKTTGMDFGSPSLKKWVESLMMTLTARSKMSIGMKSYNDNSSDSKEMKAVVADSILLWNDSNMRWYDPLMKWREPNTASYKRKFPKKGLRCRYKQVELSPVEAFQYGSETFGNVSVSYVDEAARDFRLKVVFDKYHYYYDVVPFLDENTGEYISEEIIKPDGQPVWITKCYEPPTPTTENSVPCLDYKYRVTEKMQIRNPDFVITTDDDSLYKSPHLVEYGPNGSFKVVIKDEVTGEIVHVPYRITGFFSSKNWPDDILSYLISFKEEDYENDYLVKSFDNNLEQPLMIANGGGSVLLGSDKEFKMSGIRKKQSFVLENTSIRYAPLSNLGAEYNGNSE